MRATVGLELVNEIAPLLHRHAMEALPNEAVGMVWSDGEVSRLPNERTGRHFHVSGQALVRAVESRPYQIINDIPQPHIVGLYHSHPSGDFNPSGNDLRCWKEWDKAGWGGTWMIVALKDSSFQISTFDPRGVPLNPVFTFELTHANQ